MDTSIKNLENDLKSREATEDCYSEVMSEFLSDAQTQFSILTAMRSKLDCLYSELASYFVFDKQKYTCEDFFSDIKVFKDQFKFAYDKIREDREAKSRAQRAKAAREKSLRVWNFYEGNILYINLNFAGEGRTQL